MELKDFKKPDDDSNVTLLVEGQKLYVNSDILTTFSPVFKAMFKQDFKEKHPNEIEIPTKKCNEFIDLLHSIYPPVIKITDKNVMHILALADEYLLQDIKERCFQTLMGQPETVALIVIAQTYNGEELLQKCVKKVAKKLNRGKLLNSHHYEKLSDKSKITIYELRLDKVESRLDKVEPRLKHLEQMKKECPKCSMRC